MFKFCFKTNFIWDYTQRYQDWNLRFKINENIRSFYLPLGLCKMNPTWPMDPRWGRSVKLGLSQGDWIIALVCARTVDGGGGTAHAATAHSLATKWGSQPILYKLRSTRFLISQQITTRLRSMIQLLLLIGDLNYCDLPHPLTHSFTRLF